MFVIVAAITWSSHANEPCCRRTTSSYAEQIICL